MSRAATVEQSAMGGVGTIVTVKPPTKKHYHYQSARCVGKFLHLGLGIQSSTLAEMLVEALLWAQSDRRRPCPVSPEFLAMVWDGKQSLITGVMFADTKDEPDYVYAQRDYMATRLALVGLTLIQIEKSAGGLIEDAFNGDQFATMPLWTRNPETGEIVPLRRQCTNKYKIEPADDEMLDYLLELGYATRSVDKNGVARRTVKRSVYVESWFGISTDEMERSGSRGKQWQKAVYPLLSPLRMSRVDCVRWLRAHGLPVPRKSACRSCPYHDDAYWLDMQTNRPADFELVCRNDERLRHPMRTRNTGRDWPMYIHPSCQPLRSIDFAARIAANAAPALICGQHCMT